MQVLGYARVSTDDQVKEGVSLDAQQAKLEAYAMIKDWTMVEVIRDEGISAKDLKRPGLERLLAMVKAGKIGAVIVYKLDRLTRSVSDLDKLIKLFERKGVVLVSLQESFDPTTATGRAMMGLIALFSQWEREVIGERTKEVMAYKRSRREYTGGDTPYGWHMSADGLHLEAYEPEQRVIREAIRLKDAGYSLRAIGARLERKGFLPRHGGHWYPQTVKRVLFKEVAA
jgi:site-specific DNA recombinase